MIPLGIGKPLKLNTADKMKKIEIGEKKAFGISASLIQGEKYLFIEYCFWVKGFMVGDLSQTALLLPEIETIKSILKEKGNRCFPLFKDLKDADVVAFLVNKLWEIDDQDVGIELPYNEDELKVLDLGSGQGETFQGYFMFLIEFDSYDWILCKDDVEKKNLSFKIPKGVFYDCIKELYKWISESTTLVLR